MHVHTLTCFSARPGSGNPALVIEHAAPDAGARQALARERNMTCVFIDEDGDTVRVDYFYPHMRSPLCLHATLAVAAVLFARPDAPAAIAVRTAMKDQRLELAREGGDYFVRLAAQPVPEVEVETRQVAALLGTTQAALASAPQVASVGSPKLLAEVADPGTLHALQPDLDAIAGWGRQAGVNGIYAWCRRPDGTFEGRNFNHLDPLLEDSATGVAAGALSAALGRGLVLRQGKATGRDCLIRTRLDGDALLVGGSAEYAAA